MTPKAPRVLRYLNPDDLSQGLGALLVSTLAEIQQRQDHVNLCLSGGPQVMAAIGHFATLANEQDFDATRLDLWWASERFASMSDPGRNSVQTLALLAREIVLVPSQVHAMPALTGLDDPDDAAFAYSKEVNDTTFDICLLEVDDDGHVASIFPHHPSYAAQATASGGVIGVHDAPADPPERMSMTLATINRSKQVWLLASGKSKRDALSCALRHPSRVPAGEARGTDWTLWFADQDAAADLPYFRCDL